MPQKPWHPGDQVVLREWMCERVWTARPCLVVEDSSDQSALWVPPGTKWMCCQDVDGNRVTPRHRAQCDWVLREDTWSPGALRLTVPGKPYSVWVTWKPDYQSVKSW
mgnify:CR=1 FL=1